ncbi:MAG: pyridoxal phosphate-dependent aminotransferase, partial [Pseudomonadota bacterium]|nr:pyridoxal phosphate-dependent aminotransferase [Pseudomonadota bacterium]
MTVTIPAPVPRPQINDLEETGIMKIFLHGVGRKDVIPFWAGEGDVATPDFICDAVNRSLAAGETMYSHSRGIPEMREALAAYMTRTFGVPVGEERISLTTSGMVAIVVAVQMAAGPGDEVVVLGPVWPNIYSVVEVAGASVRHAGLTQDADGWRLDLDHLFAQVTARTTAIFVNSPGNPTGWVITPEQQRRLLAFARERGIWLIVDEVYHNLVFDRDVAPSFLQVADPEDRLLVVNSFSKSWLMTGWRLGWLTHPASLADVSTKLIQVITSCCPVFLQRGAIAALEQGDPVIADLRARCRQGRDIVMDRLASWPRVRAHAPAGAFYAFFEVEGMTDSLATCRKILDQRQVGLAPGIAFGPQGEGYLRLCFASRPETLRAGLDRLEGYLGGGSRQL